MDKKHRPTKGIRHRRLHAFYESKVLNLLMMVIITSLFISYYSGSMFLPIVCAAIAFLFFIGYTLWIWIKKPATVIINGFISDINGCYTLYFLIVSAMRNPNPWWYIFPIICAVIAFCLFLIIDRDETFHILPAEENKQ